MPAELASVPASLERFEREAKTLAGLHHPNIAGIYGVEVQNGAKYLVLEFVEGETPGEIMGGHNDWANLQLGIGEGGDWEDYVHTPLDEPELSDAMATEHRESMPPPPFGCRADKNLDGAVNTLDVISFLNAWAAGDSSADINGDGTVNTLDVLAFLNAWATGC